MGHEQCLMSFFLKLLPSAAITNGDKNRTLARKLKVFPKEVNATFGILPQVQKFAKSANLTLAIPEIVYGSHDSKGTDKSLISLSLFSTCLKIEKKIMKLGNHQGKCFSKIFCFFTEINLG